MKSLVFLPTISEHPHVQSVLGNRWLERQVAAAGEAMRRRSNLSPSMMGMTTAKLAHPLVSELYEAAKPDSSAANLTPLLDLLELDLSTLGQSLPGGLQDRLRLDEESSKAMYELHIGAGLARLDHDLSWLPDKGQKRPELIVNHHSEDALSVECKKRDPQDGYEQSADQFWKHFYYDMQKRMDDDRLNYWVKVTAQEFRLGDVDRIVKEAASAMRSNPAGSTAVPDNRYQIDYLRLADPGGSIPSGILSLFPRGIYGANGGRGPRNQMRVPRFLRDPFFPDTITDPKALRLELIDDPTRRIRGILRNLKNASRQVRLGLSSIVYIDTNLGLPGRASDEFDEIAVAVGKDLQKAHTRVSAVILTDIRPSWSSDGRLGWWVQAKFIPQPRPQHPLPTEIRVPGDESGSRWFPGTWFPIRKTVTLQMLNAPLVGAVGDQNSQPF